MWGRHWNHITICLSFEVIRRMTLTILSMFTVAKAILGGTHGFARVEHNTQRFVIIVLGTAAVKLAHKSEGSRHEIFQITAR